MGVIKKNKNPYFISEDDINSMNNNEENITFNNFINLSISSDTNSEINTALNLVVSSEDEATTNENLIKILELNRRLNKTNKKKTLTKPQPMFMSLGCKGKSLKKFRRYENASFLSNPYFMKLVNNDDIFRELDIFDFVSQNTSPFSLLLSDKSKMKIWNDFNDLAEENQEFILNEMDKNEISKNKNKYQKNANLKKIKNYSENKITSQQCYARIDNCLKSVLRKKNLSATMMRDIEKELIDFFKNDPHSVFKICLESSFARLLLHACAQYHNLSCHSFDEKGNRWSYVKNKSGIFNSTIMSLSSYLESSGNKKNKSLLN